MRTLILGCGPAGLIAAHAAAQSGSDVAIFSKKRKSFMKGAQYLHEQIPGIDADKFDIDYRLMGTEEAYRFKVYGNKWNGVVSPEELLGVHPAYDIRQTYDTLWEIYSPYVVDWDATPAGLLRIMERDKPDLLVSSIPAPAICFNGCNFKATKIHSTDQVLHPIDNNTVLCNGEESPAWYRASSIQGWQNTEWSTFVPKPPITPMWEVLKPIEHNCTCWPQIMRVGRYGKWTKGVLSHDGYREVCDAIDGR